MTAATKRPAHRPTKPAELRKTHHVGVRLAPPQRAKLDRLGGPGWLVQQLDAADDPQSAHNSALHQA